MALSSERPPPRGDAILIAAQSGRALAQAARRSGLRPYVLDLFGDADTLALAEGYRPAVGRFGDGLAGEGVLAGLDALAAMADKPPIGIVLGSGFENAPDLMARIGRCRRLLGASPDTVRVLKDPLAFAALCDRLAIPHPAVTRKAVTDRSDWLLKRSGGSGGSHIRLAGAGRAPTGAYFQRRVAGTAHAVAFLADGREAAIVAVTEQWSAPSPLRPFRYAGALERAAHEAPALSPASLSQVTAAIAGLVAETGLVGLASADLLVSETGWWLTEINPRPGATLDVLDRRDTPLLAAHIDASLGVLPRIEPAPVDAAATEICYAAAGYAPMPPLDWPDFVRDRPQSGTCVPRDAPLCTVFAAGPDSAATRDLLRVRAATLRTLLAPTEEAR
ncbi:ATP-grasp domain-containing protein [Methylobacterium sp. 88A]|uniref:ATP-grasp domain-containing protein n=1 Tax=Methylobacterium sp. 88A TaxID=1131813 RepID=UPI0003611079|nr:ATP-grasp domain-containing protein [Methylobacterium sp. 88A]